MKRIRFRFLLMFAVALMVPAVAWATGQVVTGNVVLNANFTEQVTSGVLATQNLPVPITQTVSYTNGTGAQQVDTIYGSKQTLTASTPVTLDLTSLTDPAGVSITFARVREFIVQVTDTTAAHSVAVEQGASNGVVFLNSSAINVQPKGGMISLRDPQSTGGSSSVGWYVDSTHKTVKLDPGSNTVTGVNILIVGTSAQ
jgi:hypothetical protein